MWVAAPEPAGRRGFYRFAEGGELLEHVPTEHAGVAVMLGGPEGTDLFMLEAAVLNATRAEVRTRGNSRVRVGSVEVPGAGRP